MGETPLFARLLFASARQKLKLLLAHCLRLRFSGWPGQANGSKANGLVEVGSSTTLTTYGEVVEISAIVAIGDRVGVNLIWGQRGLRSLWGRHYGSKRAV